MSEGNEPKKKSSAESMAECSSIIMTSKIDADMGHLNLSPMIRCLVENMTEEHWRIVREALCFPGTKEEVGHLCAGIVMKVVQAARCYLLPALCEILGVPAAHVVMCERRRMNPSEENNAVKSPLGQRTDITHEMQLAVAKKEVDKILQASVKIVSGLQSDVPILVEGTMLAYPAKASSLSGSLALLSHLTDAKFQTKATKHVSDILLKNLKNESCPGSSASVSVEDDDGSNAEVESQTELCQVHGFYPSGCHSQTIADDLVADVFESMDESVSGQDINLAAHKIVGCMIEEIKNLFETAQSIGAVSMKLINTTSQRMSSGIQNLVRKLFSKSSSDGKMEMMMARARNLISQVIMSMQHEIPSPKSAQELEEEALIRRILGALLAEVQTTDRPQSPRLQPQSSRSADIQKDDENTLCASPVPPEVTTEGISPVCQVVDTTIEWENLVPFTKREEELISDTKIEKCSHDIAVEIQKILKNYHGVQTLFVPVEKSLSDSVLFKLRPRAGEKKDLPSGFIYSYVEEAVKRFFLSFLFPSASSDNQQLSQHNLEALNSSSEDFKSTVNVFTKVMTQEVMVTLFAQLEENVTSHDDMKKLLRVDHREHKDLAQNSLCAIDSFLSLLMESTSNDYAPLVCMLVIQLLKKINSLHQNADLTRLPDNILDMSKDMTEKVLLGLNRALGISGDDHYPQSVNCHQILKGVYRELTQDFGSENALLAALEAQSQPFVSSVVEKLTKEIIKTCGHTCTPAPVCAPPVQHAGETHEKRGDKTCHRMFSFNLKMPTFRWKKSKKENSIHEGKGSPVANPSDSETKRKLQDLSKNASQLSATPKSAGLHEESQNEPTNIKKKAKAGPCESFEESYNVPGHATHFETRLDETTAELTAAGVPTKQEETESVLADTSDPDMGSSLSHLYS